MKKQLIKGCKTDATTVSPGAEYIFASTSNVEYNSISLKDE